MINPMKVRILANQLARELRQKQTETEEMFWEMVRNKRCANIKFYRQYPIVFAYEREEQYRFFIADFFCREARLVVEIDGGVHETQKEYDMYRTYLMNQMQIKVLRFSNKEIREHPVIVLEQVKKALCDKPLS